jgi:hypothetical protein
VNSEQRTVRGKIPKELGREGSESEGEASHAEAFDNSKNPVACFEGPGSIFRGRGENSCLVMQGVDYCFRSRVMIHLMKCDDTQN